MNADCVIVDASIEPEFFTLMGRRHSSVRSAMFIARLPQKVIFQLR